MQTHRIGPPIEKEYRRAVFGHQLYLSTGPAHHGYLHLRTTHIAPLEQIGRRLVPTVIPLGQTGQCHRTYDFDHFMSHRTHARPRSQSAANLNMARASFSAASTPQDHTSPAETSKHAATEDNQGSSSQKKKKRRVALSCAECAKRKQRCNRETPCQHCVARRVPELCVPFSRTVTSPNRRRSEGRLQPKTEPGQPVPVRQPGMLPTLSVRVARIEALLNVVVNRVDGIEGKALSDWRISKYTDRHEGASTDVPRSCSSAFAPSHPRYHRLRSSRITA